MEELNRNRSKIVNGEFRCKSLTLYNNGPTKKMYRAIVDDDQEMSVVLVNWMMKFIQEWSESLPGFLKHLYVDDYPALLCLEARDADFFADDEFTLFVSARQWEWYDGLRLLCYSKILIPICGPESHWTLVLVDIPKRSLLYYSPGICHSAVGGEAVLNKVKRWIDEEAGSVCNSLKAEGEDDIADYVTQVMHIKWSTSSCST